MTILLCDPRVAAVPLADCGEPLVALDASFGPARAPLDATPEESDGTCRFAAGGISADARAHRRLLAAVLTPSGLVTHPTEWWHWSYGDRWWALATGAEAAVYGPVTGDVDAA